MIYNIIQFWGIKMNEKLQEKIDILSKKYNYYENKRAENTLKSLDEEEAKIVLNDEIVKKTILEIENIYVLRKIFRLTPAFFQEIMFDNEKTQNALIQLSYYLTHERIKEFYQRQGKILLFKEEDLRNLEIFIHTIKSPKIYDQLIENKYFRRIIALCKKEDLRSSFFKNMDEVKLFHNIINDKDLYDTLTNERKEKLIGLFNKVSNHLLLPKDYEKVLDSPINLIVGKTRWNNNKKVIVSKETLSMMKPVMIAELLTSDYVDRDFIENYVNEKVNSDIEENNYQLEDIFKHLINRNHRIEIYRLSYSVFNFNKVDLIYFKKIIEKCQNDLDTKNNFIDFIYKILIPDNTICKKDELLIKESLFREMSSERISYENYQHLFYYPNLLKTVFYLKFHQTAARMDYLNGISYKQIMHLNIKHINQILNNFSISNEDEISNIYSYAIRFYLIFGYERSLRIIKGEYGRLVRTFFDNLSMAEVKNVQLIEEGNKYIPIISKDFINFMFASKENNHFINMLNGTNSLLMNNWSYFYNHIDEIKEKCHGVITLKKLNVILKQLSPTRELSDVTPDNYRLNENNILNDVCLGNKTSNPNEMVYKELLDIYDKMKRRVESSIPYVKGIASNGYHYEMMKLNDPIAFTVGYQSNCCYRVLDIGHNHLLHSVLCRNGRILLIYDENYHFKAFVPLKRNGEVLIANSIECLHKIKNDKAINAFSDAIKDIVVISKENEKENAIKLVCIGEEAYAKPAGIPFPKHINTPTIYEICERNYYNTDCYHRNLRIVYQDPKLNLTKIKYGNPECSYYDERCDILTCDFINRSNPNVEKALKVIDAIRYTKGDIEEIENFEPIKPYNLRKCIFNEDWYLAIDYAGNIYGDYLDYNEKAKLEFQIAYQELIKELNKQNDISYQKVKNYHKYY